MSPDTANKSETRMPHLQSLQSITLLPQDAPTTIFVFIMECFRETAFLLQDICVALQLQAPPTCYSSLSGRALRARSVPRVSPRVSPKTGVFEGVSEGVFPGPFGPRAPECPKSVPRVSPECSRHLFDTLSEHFLDTRSLRSAAPKGPREHPFSGTPSSVLKLLHYSTLCLDN